MEAQRGNGGQAGEMDMDEMQMAIQALSSLKGNPSSLSESGHSAASSSSRHAASAATRPSEITLPPISTFLNGHSGGHANGGHSSSDATPNGHHQHYLHHRHSNGHAANGVQYSYVSASGGRYSSDSNGHHRSDHYGASSSASTSAYTYSAVTTPSARTTTSLSSPGSPNGYDHSAYFGHDAAAGVDEHASYEHQTNGHAESGALVRTNGNHQLQEAGDDGFIGRVSQLPLVSGALRVYERGRNSSRVVKYGTDLMETSMKTISKPVINRMVGPNLVGQIDEFACRQLDRFGGRAGSSPRRTPTQEDRFNGEGYEDDDNRHAITYEDVLDNGTAAIVRRGDEVGSETCLTPRLSNASNHALELQQRPPAEVVQSSRAGRSRWQSLVIEAGVTAGGIGAAVSEESMKSLKYCLHWLHYATAHLDHQVGILREFILSLSSQHRGDALMRSEDARAASILDGIKRDVVEIIRKVVDVVSTYAGAALPEQAKRYVRSSILGLPEKWARAMQGQDQAQALNGASDNLQDEATMSTAGAAEPSSFDESQPTGTTPSPTQNAAERTLTFAVESLDMLRGVLGIFNDSVDRADAWVERLRLVGLQRQEAFVTADTAAPSNVQVSDIRSVKVNSTVNGLRKRDEEGQESFRRRKNFRHTNGDTEMDVESEEETR